MIQARLQISGQINGRENLTGELNTSIKETKPELEMLEIEPEFEDKIYIPKKYGFEKVLAKKIETENLQINPSLEKQEYIGIYREVVANPIPKKSIIITPKKEDQKFEGVYTDVNVEKINTEQIKIAPQVVEQKKEGLYDEVIVSAVTSEIDKNILPNNIKKGIVILGVNGEFDGIDTSDATASSQDIRKGKTAYIDGNQITGELEEYSKLFFEAQDMEYMVGGTYGPTGSAIYNGEDLILCKGSIIDMLMPIEKTKELLGITSEKILPGNEILGVLGTATMDANVSSNQILAGKVAYSQGEKIEGTMPNNGTLSYTPTDSQQVIPSGYTEGGYIEPANIETLQDYNICLSIAEKILGEGV